MKLTIDRKHLIDLLSVAGSTASNAAKDVLANVKLDATDDLRIDSSDGELGAIQRSKQATIEKPGKCLMDARRVCSILSPSKAELVEIETTDSAVILTAGKSRFELPFVDPDSFPSVKPIEGAGIEVPGAALLNAIRKTIFAIDTDSTRYQLGGVLFEVYEDGLFLVATDGRRLSVAAIDIGGGPSFGGPIVGPKGLQAILRTFSDAPSVTLRSDGRSMQVETEKAVTICRLIEGRFPNWRSVLPANDFAHTIPINAGLLKGALTQASLFTENDSRGIELKFGPGQLVIRARQADKGRSEIEIPVDTSADIATTIDWRFALDFVKEAAADDVIEFNIKNKSERVLFTSGSWRYVVMPMERN